MQTKNYPLRFFVLVVVLVQYAKSKFTSMEIFYITDDMTANVCFWKIPGQFDYIEGLCNHRNECAGLKYVLLGTRETESWSIKDIFI